MRELTAAGAGIVRAIPFDATDTSSHQSTIEQCFADHPDIDLVLIAFGVLGHGAGVDTDPAAAAEAVITNYVGAVSSGLAAARCLRDQGHGTIVVLSSVAGERARKSNFVYGSSKAGLDAFAQGLGDALVGSGVRVIVIRPGFVHSKMTEGLDPAPFATTPEAVANAITEALASGKEIVWVPSALRWVALVFRLLPRPLWRSGQQQPLHPSGLRWCDGSGGGRAPPARLARAPPSLLGGSFAPPGRSNGPRTCSCSPRRAQTARWVTASPSRHADRLRLLLSPGRERHVLPQRRGRRGERSPTPHQAEPPGRRRRRARRPGRVVGIGARRARHRAVVRGPLGAGGDHRRLRRDHDAVLVGPQGRGRRRHRRGRLGLRAAGRGGRDRDGRPDLGLVLDRGVVRLVVHGGGQAPRRGPRDRGRRRRHSGYFARRLQPLVPRIPATVSSGTVFVAYCLWAFEKAQEAHAASRGSSSSIVPVRARRLRYAPPGRLKAWAAPEGGRARRPIARCW